jgi:hypothetical protein
VQAGDGGHEVLGMRADVADGAGRAAARGVGAPVGLLVGSAGFDGLASQPWLYSTTTLRTSPISPERTISRACRTIG